MEKYGIGPGIIGRLQLLPYSRLFYHAGKFHDIAYKRGGTEKDKRRVDFLFFRLMLTVSKTPTQIFFANLYYDAVKSYGHLFFNYNSRGTTNKNKLPECSEPKREIATRYRQD